MSAESSRDADLGDSRHELGKADVEVVEDRDQVHHRDVTEAVLVVKDRSLGQPHCFGNPLLRNFSRDSNPPESRPDCRRQCSLR